MIGRLTGRAGFARLRAEGHRGRSGDLFVIAVPDANMTPPRVAFSVGRKVGSSVVRHRITRRLRAASRALASTGDLPNGLYLVGAGATSAVRPFIELRDDLARAVQRATTESGR